MGQCISNKASTSQEIPTISRKEEYILRIQAILRGTITRRKVNFKDIKGGMNYQPLTLTSENNRVKVIQLIRKLKTSSDPFSANPTHQPLITQNFMRE